MVPSSEISLKVETDFLFLGRDWDVLYIGSTPTFLYFDLYLNTAYAAHYVYFTIKILVFNCLFIYIKHGGSNRVLVLTFYSHNYQLWISEHLNT